MMRKTKYDEHSGNYETSPNDAEKMEEAQEKLAQQEITGTSGGGLVKITLNGKFEAKKSSLTNRCWFRKKSIFWKTSF